MEDISPLKPTWNPQPLREMPVFGTLAHSPGAELVGSTAAVIPIP